MWAFMQTEHASNMLTFSYFIYFKYVNPVVSSLSSLIHFSSFRGHVMTHARAKLQYVNGFFNKRCQKAYDSYAHL